jgi:hypothetical protein
MYSETPCDLPNHLVEALEREMEDEDASEHITSPFATTANTAAQDVEEDYGPIEAFIKDDFCDDTSIEELDAENIDVLPTRSEVASGARSKLRLYSILGAVCLVITIIAVMVPISLTVLRTNATLKIKTYAPSQAPSAMPSQSPTSFEFTEYVTVLSQVSSIELLMTPGSPQYRASKWIYDVDPIQRSLSDPRLLQRYIAAVFYYSTSNGNGWADCYPGDVGCTSAGKESWFSSHDECKWFGFEDCNDNGFVTRFVISE